MKYNDKNLPLQCMMTKSTCYKGTGKMTIKGILWHSTGCNNPNLKRYVQPSENDPNYATLIQKIGKNYSGNDWNHTEVQAGLNCWVGKLANGEVSTVQTMPWDYRPWGCGSGKNGSCNSGWIQFEICEDALNDANYFNKAYQEALEITAYLCKKYNIDPKGTVKFNGVTVPTILCHYDSYNLGLGSGHYDIYNWFPKFGKNMDNVRNDVKKLLDGDQPSALYRIRKSWDDPKSQIGAYADLETAKKECPEDYFVFDMNGKILYEGDNNMTDARFNELMNNWIEKQAEAEASAWSANDRAWAESNGYIAGDNKGRKMYKKFITREELVAVLHRYEEKH